MTNAPHLAIVMIVKKYVSLIVFLACLVIAVWTGLFLLISHRPGLVGIGAQPTVAPSPTPTVTHARTPRPTNTPRPTPNATATQRAQATAAARIETALDYLPGDKIYLSQTNGYVRVILNFLDWHSYYDSETLLHGSDIWASLVVENVGTQTIHTNPFYFTIIDNRGRIYSHSSESYRTDLGFRAIDLRPGTYSLGGLIFDLGFHVYPAHLIYDDGLTPPITLDIENWLTTHEPEPTPTTTPIARIDVDQSIEYAAGLGTITIVVHSLDLDEDSTRLEYSIYDENQRQDDWSIYDDPHNCGHRFYLFQDDLSLNPLSVPGAPLCGRKRWTGWSWVEYFSPIVRRESSIFIQLRDGYTSCTMNLNPIEIGICQFFGHIFVVKYSGR